MNVVVRELQTLWEAGSLSGLSDGQLLDRFVERREEAAFDVIVRRHGPMVWGVCRRVLRDHHDAEDAFQATFLVLARKAASIMIREKLGNWLYGVAYQTAMKARAMRGRRRGRECQVPGVPEPVMMPHDLQGAVAEILDQELSRLPEKYRIPIVLCELEGITLKEAANQLGWPIGTVSSRLSRAKSMLAKRLAHRGISLSTGSLLVLLAPDAASASMPTQLIGSTAQAACLFAAGGMVPTRVAILTGEVMKMMLLSKLKTATGMLVVVSALAVGGTGLAYQAQANEPGHQNGIRQLIAKQNGKGQQIEVREEREERMTHDGPHRKDTRLPRPRQARLTPYAVPKKLKPGQTFTYNIKVSLDDGWMIFPFSPRQPVEGGPYLTTFDLFDTGGFEVVDDWQASRPATVVRHPTTYPDRPTVECFEEEVTWSIRLKVPQDMEAGEKTVRCQASYQLTNEKSATAPGRWTLGEVRIQVGRDDVPRR